MKPIQQTIRELDLNMDTLQGRYRYALMILDVQSQRMGHPIQPESIAGVRPSDVKKIIQKGNPAPEDKRTMREFGKWRDRVIEIEGINELHLRGALRAIQIFDEAIADAIPEEKEEIELKRETLVFYMRNEFDVQGAELSDALADIFTFARSKTRDFVAFSSYWRDPGRWTP